MAKKGLFVSVMTKTETKKTRTTGLWRRVVRADKIGFLHSVPKTDFLVYGNPVNVGTNVYFCSQNSNHTQKQWKQATQTRAGKGETRF